MARDVDFFATGPAVKHVEPGAWLAGLSDPAVGVSVHDRYVGFARRDDAWFCRDRRVGSHWLLLVLDGEARARVAGRSYRLCPGGLLWIPPGVSHDMRWSQTLDFAELYVRAVRAGQSLTPQASARVWVGAESLRSPLDRVADEVQLGGPHHEANLRALLVSLFVRLWRLREGPASIATGSDPLNAEQQSRLVRLTRQRVIDGLTPADLAAAVGLSGDYFGRRFRATFNASPRVWLNRRRIDAARRLLEETDLAVYEVADRLGYAGAAQFSRQFTKVVGVSPRAYRSSS